MHRAVAAALVIRLRLALVVAIAAWPSFAAADSAAAGAPAASAVGSPAATVTSSAPASGPIVSAAPPATRPTVTAAAPASADPHAAHAAAREPTEPAPPVASARPAVANRPPPTPSFEPEGTAGDNGAPPPAVAPPVAAPVAPRPAAPAAPAPVPAAPSPVVLAPAPARSAPAPSASAPARASAKSDVAVRLGDTSVFAFRVPGGGLSPQERARRASKALAAAFKDPTAGEVRVDRHATAAVIYVGNTPITELFEEDALAAGNTSLDVYASSTASSVRQALRIERDRSRLDKTVFSLSLVVFFALIAIYLLRKVGEVAERVRVWLEQNGDRVLAIRVQRIELVTPAVLKSSALIAVGLAKWVGQFGIFYAWLLIVLSLFEATRGYTQRLTGFVVTPFSQFMERVATALPLFVVAAIAAVAVFVLIRFVGLFFASVARQETALSWLPPELAPATSVLLRVGIVVVALVFAAPIVTGDPDGALGRAGAIALIAVGISGVPLLATGLVGCVVLYGRRLRIGEHVEFGGALGRITAINLFELRVETWDKSELRIPHLLLLRAPLRGLGVSPRVVAELAVSAAAAPSTVLDLFERAAESVGRDVVSEIVRADADGVLYRVSAACPALDAKSRLVTALLEALSSAAIPLGRTESRARRE